MPTIVVTGARYTGVTAGSNPIALDFDAASGGFAAFYLIDSFGQTIAQIASGGERDWDIPADSTNDKPAVEVKDGTAEEVATIMQAVDQADLVPDLQDALADMQDKNVTFVWEFRDSAPREWDSTTQAEISIPITQNPDGSQEFQPNTAVTIVVARDRVDATGNGDLNHVIAHELTHLIRDVNGRFLTDASGKTYQREGELYDKLLKDFDPADISESSDLTIDYAASHIASIVGTDGNNLIETPAFQNDSIWTGDGNDIIISGSGADGIVVDGTGFKVISDFGSNFDSITLNWLDSISDLVFTRVGNDAYLNDAGSSYAPLDDPNATVLVGWGAFNGADHIEFVRAANGELASLQSLGGSGPSLPFFGLSAVGTRVDDLMGMTGVGTNGLMQDQPVADYVSMLEELEQIGVGLPELIDAGRLGASLVETGTVGTSKAASRYDADTQFQTFRFEDEDSAIGFVDIPAPQSPPESNRPTTTKAVDPVRASGPDAYEPDLFHQMHLGYAEQATWELV